MICYLEGKILEVHQQYIELLTENGIGYEININERIFAEHIGKEHTHLFIYHHISENAQSLFGFSNTDDKKVFKELIKISGVGGKVAMQILSLGTSILLEAIQNEDQKTIQSIKGVGKKMSEKIILELKDKDLGVAIHASDTQKQASNINPAIQTELTNTLKHM